MRSSIPTPTEGSGKPAPSGQPDFNRFSKKTQKRRNSRRLLLVVILCGILSAVFIFTGIQLMRGPGIHISLGKDLPVISFGSPGEKVLLVMGVDAPNRLEARNDGDAFEGTRTDTMMLARIDGRRNAVSVVSIPRDSKVYLAGNRGIDKINAAHAIGGPDMAVQTVQDAFGIPIDNFVVINFKGVRELVDTLGGIDIYIEKRMRYTDNTAKLFIDFQPGKQRLDGKQAEAFLRFRHDELGDIGRIRRQQQFIVAVVNKLKSPMTVARIPKLVELANKYVETDLTGDEMLSLAFFGKDVKMHDIRSATLPGRPGGIRVSYWVIDPIAAQMVLDRLILNNPYPPGSSIDAADTSPIKIGIFYDPALAEEVAGFEKLLEQNSFEVVCKGRQRRTSTQIIEHTPRTTNELTAELREIDGRLANARLTFAPVGTTFESNACSAGEDYTLVLGADANRQ